MRLATYRNGSPDGGLVIVSRDQARACNASAIAPDLLTALRNWQQVEPALRRLAESLEDGSAADVMAFDPTRCLAPLPRAPQWLDGSAFLNHGRLMDVAFNKPPIPDFDTIPVMYQGASDDFLGPQADVPFVTEADGIDFEGEFGVIVDDVPMAVSPEQAAQRIRLLVQINDWSLRAVGAREVRTGFGFLQAKPSTSFAPMAVTPDEVGDAWRDGRLDMALHVHRNGERIGAASGREMAFSFPQLIAHAARTRRLTAGTIIGSGTVSNADRAAGSSCLAEVRAIEMIERGEARTPFLRFGDEVTMQACFADGRGGPFGRIAQRVVRAAGTDRPE
ncbi:MULTISPECIES: fumarylacetoacetate hydrolase family protein [Bradyrhizobium]|jgi:fumarylacetoacetate (FAA) hydrolase|uniref:Fumarylacetoacetate hydrolase family protein n=1 Tax=Bradyrhizobium denitrificans TaxID=2734912 RepID=A0ABS5GFZ5_9BRAD|nr:MULTISPECIES: fumarylacetoacetate hydrolase family protein [Bradyrhizobium]RTM01972.1 MAG: FAA hydrolase family protein [Bradyrhizobiaceae bacterium]MBR1140254.1 fumarylacetoacetate hydrolase family protein [Bradyrhizobium denitrificans]MCL8488139.1 fumarylacetoacetate hydrolase family protein [Bradyrhizobium denitrificans]MDU1496245.1 fumarylacetoacetate hydrolase family protein [Bradyrhizobium sp.]MDU1546479.1 fumarylacetoacetate hydrolase family protein [Bradyrhizobium sp.]